MSPGRQREPHRVTHIFFDVDGTLVDFNASLRSALEAAAEYASQRLGRIVTPQALHEVRERVFRIHRGKPLAAVRLESFRQFYKERGIDDEAAVLETNRRFFEARDGSLETYPDVVPALEALRARGFVLVAATNGNAALMRTPVFDYLHATWGAEEAGISKPHPDFFHGALAKVDATAASSLMVGDRIDNDVEPAVAVGMSGILIDRDATVDRANAEFEVIHAMTELPARVLHSSE